jgi:hypothetical protein
MWQAARAQAKAAGPLLVKRRDDAIARGGMRETAMAQPEQGHRHQHQGRGHSERYMGTGPSSSQGMMITVTRVPALMAAQ